MKCERTHERDRPDGSVERWTTVEDMPDPEEASRRRMEKHEDERHADRLDRARELRDQQDETTEDKT